MPEKLVLEVPAFFGSDAPVRPRSKIKRRIIPAVCLGFCLNASVKHTARKTGLSEKTVRNLYADLRALLTDPRYRKWHNYDLESVFAFPGGDKIVAGIWACFGACYFHDECFRNYRYGKRKARQCAVCPVRQADELAPFLTPELVESMLDLIETTRALYQVLLGRSKEDVADQGAAFRLRAYHATIVLTAHRASHTIVDGAVRPDMGREGPQTLQTLWRTMLEHIAEHGKL